VADESADLFLQIFKSKSGGSVGLTDKNVIQGETSDEAMAGRGIEITEFDISFGKPTMKSGGDLKELLKTSGSKMDNTTRDAVEELRLKIEGLEKDPVLKKLADEEGSDNSPSLSVSKYVDASTPALLKAYNDSCSAKSPLFETVIITSFRAGGGQVPFLRAIFGAVRLVSYKLQMSEPLPKEDLEFEFGQCKLEYWPQTSEGTRGEMNRFGWDFIKKAEWRKVVTLVDAR